METVNTRGTERHQGEAERIAYDLGTLCIELAPNQAAIQDAARRGDLGEEMSALTRQAFERGEGSPRFRKLMGVLQSMEAALVALYLALCVVVPSGAYAVDLGTLEELTSNTPSAWGAEPLYGTDRVQADAYVQERLDLNTYQAERSAEIQAPVTYGAPSYQSPTHNFTAYGPNGTALKCTQTARATDCF
ncbi:MAG: hypothetical protein JSR20_14775 [Nitrospira sp.]|nr:hypothetical protein [Nitrospira sp.]